MSGPHTLVGYWLPRLLHDVFAAYGIVFWVWQVVDAYNTAKGHTPRADLSSPGRQTEREAPRKKALQLTTHGRGDRLAAERRCSPNSRGATGLTMARVGRLTRVLVAAGVIVSTVGCDRVTKEAAARHLAGQPRPSLAADSIRLENRGCFLSLGAELPRGLAQGGLRSRHGWVAHLAWRVDLSTRARGGLGPGSGTPLGRWCCEPGRPHCPRQRRRLPQSRGGHSPHGHLQRGRRGHHCRCHLGRTRARPTAYAKTGGGVAALAHYLERPAIGFSDCLVLEIARQAGHLPLGTFDRNLSKLDGAERLVG
jgi:hypothetical protein